MTSLAAATVLPFLYVSDWPASERFYKDQLGLVWQPITSDWVLVTAGSSTLALISEAKRHEQGPVHRAGVFFSLPAGLAELVSDLAGAGVPIVRPLRTFSHGAEAAIADPDGNVLVLYQTDLATARPAIT